MASTRNTLQRDVVLDTVQNMDNHPSADEVYYRLKEDNPSISRATVFRNLEVLSKKGKILKVKMPSGADCYDFNTSDHFHIRCQMCKKVFDIDVEPVDIPDVHAELSGFIVKECAISFIGVCPRCKNR